MLNIKTIFKFIEEGLESKLDRFVVLNDEHILDTKTGVEFHLFDEDFKITHGDKVIATKQDFTTDEQSCVMEMKDFITDPQLAKERREKYPIELKKRREKFSDLYEYPEAAVNPNSIVEEDTVEYLG